MAAGMLTAVLFVFHGSGSALAGTPSGTPLLEVRAFESDIAPLVAALPASDFEYAGCAQTDNAAHRATSGVVGNWGLDLAADMSLLRDHPLLDGCVTLSGRSGLEFRFERAGVNASTVAATVGRNRRLAAVSWAAIERAAAGTGPAPPGGELDSWVALAEFDLNSSGVSCARSLSWLRGASAVRAQATLLAGAGNIWGNCSVQAANTALAEGVSAVQIAEEIKPRLRAIASLGDEDAVTVAVDRLKAYPEAVQVALADEVDAVSSAAGWSWISPPRLMAMALSPFGSFGSAVAQHLCLSSTALLLGAVAVRALFPRRRCGECGSDRSVSKVDWVATIVFKGMVAVAKQAADYDGLGGHRGTEKKLVCGHCGVDWNPNPTGALGCVHVAVLWIGMALGCLGVAELVGDRW